MATKLQPGYWKAGQETGSVLLVEGDKLIFKSLFAFDYPDIQGKFAYKVEFGDFGEARKELAEATGCDKLNAHITSSFFNFKAIVNEEGTVLTLWEGEIVEWKMLSDDELSTMKNDREPWLAPSCPGVKPCPETAGKIYWLSGPPGTGKSTTCQLMAKEGGFTYYEGDCIMQLLNPFVDVNAEDPAKAAFKQKPMKDVPRDLLDTVLGVSSGMEEMLGSGSMSKYDELMRPLYGVMSKHIELMKKRLGGDIAVAQAVMSKASRDSVRSILGNQVVFIMLNLSLESAQKRLESRHGDVEGASGLTTKMHKIYQPAEDNEPNTHNIDIDDKMSKADVVAKVMSVVKDTSEAK